MIPTVGFNMRKITKGNVTIKLWDIGGQVSHQLPNNSQQTKLRLLFDESSETIVFQFTAFNFLQPRFRSMWERYCRGVNAIVYMVDAADHDKIEVRLEFVHQWMKRFN